MLHIPYYLDIQMFTKIITYMYIFHITISDSTSKQNHAKIQSYTADDDVDPVYNSK